jgi:bacterioferritin
MIAKRITELNGEPNLDPSSITKRSHSEYKSCATLKDMIVEDLVAERIAISTYNEIVRWLGDGDITSRRVIEVILAKEEEHADDLVKLLGQIGQRS